MHASSLHPFFHFPSTLMRTKNKFVIGPSFFLLVSLPSPSLPRGGGRAMRRLHRQPDHQLAPRRGQHGQAARDVPHEEANEGRGGRDCSGNDSIDQALSRGRGESRPEGGVALSRKPGLFYRSTGRNVSNKAACWRNRRVTV
jgi:hypothetical protein